MDKKIFFEDARKSVLEFFSIEFPTMSIESVDHFVSMFYQLVNYEEESQKIRPHILITSNINSVIRNVPNSKKILFYEDQDMVTFKARIKALMCFCRSDWSIYVNFGEDCIEYGIIKTLTSIKEKSLINAIKKTSTLETISKKTNLILLTVYGGGVCELIGAKGNKYSICFNLNSQSEYNWDNQIAEFVEAAVSKIKTTQKKLSDIKTLLTNIFYRVLRDLHGTICIVVDKEYKDKNGFLADGTWLKEPIEFGKMFLRSSKYDENVLRSYADVLTTMLDFDGITVLDNAGRIRAYNVFIEANNDNKTKIVGGARRRAAYSILQNKSKKIIGVYFQSQDGDNFYKEKSDLRRKKKIKIVGGEVVNENDDMLPLEILLKLQQAKKKEEDAHKEELEKLEKEKQKVEKEKEEAEKAKMEAEKAKLEAEKELEEVKKELEEHELEEAQNENIDNSTEEIETAVDEQKILAATNVESSETISDTNIDIN